METLVNLEPPLEAQGNMDRDFNRLLELKPGDPSCLSFYAWKRPSITYGYFTKPEQWLNLDVLKEAGYSLGKRPTGGGVIFHTHDLAFSVLIPKGHPRLSDNTLENYALINGMVKKAIGKAHFETPELLQKDQTRSNFCMAEPTIYDVMVSGKKVGGAAQRRGKQGLLHQGTISLSLPPRADLIRFIKDPVIVDQIVSNTYPLQVTPEKMVEDLKAAFLTTLH